MGDMDDLSPTQLCKDSKDVAGRKLGCFPELSGPYIQQIFSDANSETLKEKLDRCVWLITAGDEPELKFQKQRAAESSLGANVCGRVWNIGDIAYRCRTCEANPNCAICVECFEASDHTNHNYVKIKTFGGCCDCGDPSAWRPTSFCGKHELGEESYDYEEDELFVERATTVLSLVLQNSKAVFTQGLPEQQGAEIPASGDLSEVLEMLKHLCCSSTSLRRIVCEALIELEDIPKSSRSRLLERVLSGEQEKQQQQQQNNVFGSFGDSNTNGSAPLFDAFGGGQQDGFGSNSGGGWNAFGGSTSDTSSTNNGTDATSSWGFGDVETADKTASSATGWDAFGSTEQTNGGADANSGGGGGAADWATAFSAPSSSESNGTSKVPDLFGEDDDGADSNANGRSDHHDDHEFGVAGAFMTASADTVASNATAVGGGERLDTSMEGVDVEQLSRRKSRLGVVRYTHKGVEYVAQVAEGDGTLVLWEGKAYANPLQWIKALVDEDDPLRKVEPEEDEVETFTK